MYMSPEQITAQGVDDRADIYAIGLTMYYALTGQNAVSETWDRSLIHAQLSKNYRIYRAAIRRFLKSI